MIETVTENTFINEMSKEIHGFSVEGAQVLFHRFKEGEADSDQQIEFIPATISGKPGFIVLHHYAEYENLEEVLNDYSNVTEVREMLEGDYEDEEEVINALREFMEVIEIPGSKRLIVPTKVYIRKILIQG